MIPKNNIRYERKIPVSEIVPRELEDIIRLHPACFKEIYYERIVNNIYFDTAEYDSLRDNLSGKDKRVKARIRWYGDNTDNFPATLELKIKEGLAGYKRIWDLGNIHYSDVFNENKRKVILHSLPQDIKTNVLNLHPVLVNSYKRKYFLSFDNKFRLTLDKDIVFLRSGIMHSMNMIKDECVIELKYEVKYESEASDLISQFPFRIDKFSKYVNGIFSTI